MSLRLIGSEGVWAGVWYCGSTLWIYCADSGSKRISAAQTLAPNYVIYSQWQRPYWDVLPSLFHSGRKRRCIVHLFYSCCVRNRSLVHSFTNPYMVYGGWVDYTREEVNGFGRWHIHYAWDLRCCKNIFVRHVLLYYMYLILENNINSNTTQNYFIL